jgi:membrane protease YdiL (CAAX protease family)
MNNKKTIILGLILTPVIFLVSVFTGVNIHIDSELIPGSFMQHLLMLVLSCVAIWILRKDLNFHIALPRFTKILKPFFIGVLIMLIINIPMTVITNLIEGKVSANPLLEEMNGLQTFLFIFILASIAEEFLFRGFLLNSLKSLKERGITIIKLRLSLPVIISAVAFGLVHLILITAGADYMLLIRTVLFTFVLGLAAGYYQEKYENNTAYAIIVHMGGNLLGVVSSLIMSIS